MWKYKGYDYTILLTKLGHLCGYVRLRASDKYYGKHYDQIPVQCHGGLTFSELVPAANKFLPKGYWIGFDCAHLGDLSIHTAALIEGLQGKPSFMANDHLWQPAEVKAECESIIDQLIKMKVHFGGGDK